MGLGNAAVGEFSAIRFPTDDRAVAVTIAAARSSRRVLGAFASVFLNPAQRPTPTKRNRRRPSIKRIMKDAKELGFNIEIVPDGTTRLIAKTENSDNSDVASDRNEWDDVT